MRRPSFNKLASEPFIVCDQFVRSGVESHSRRKTPIVGIAICRSECKDKQLWYWRLRRHERVALIGVKTEPDRHMAVLENEVSQVWTMGKDGKRFFSPER